MDPPPRSQSNEAFDQAVTSLSKGWNMFSLAATKIASTASENAWKFSGIASQKATEISGTVSDKVIISKTHMHVIFSKMFILEVIYDDLFLPTLFDKNDKTTKTDIYEMNMCKKNFLAFPLTDYIVEYMPHNFFPFYTISRLPR